MDGWMNRYTSFLLVLHVYPSMSSTYFQTKWDFSLQPFYPVHSSTAAGFCFKEEQTNEQTQSRIMNFLFTEDSGQLKISNFA